MRSTRVDLPLPLCPTTYIYYLVMLYSIINPLKDFSKASYNIPKGLASMERVDKILKAENTIKEPASPKHIASFEHQIEFRHVSFRYGEQWVLRDINLVIEKGKTVALVGQSGSGKSTLVDLIPRYYGGFLSIALAMLTRCRCPPESRPPRSPMLVS